MYFWKSKNAGCNQFSVVFTEMAQDVQLESFEYMLKPTRKHRGVLLLLYFAVVVTQGYTSYRLYRDVLSYTVSVPSRVVTCRISIT